MKKGELNDVTAKGCKSLVKAAYKEQCDVNIKHDEIALYEMASEPLDENWFRFWIYACVRGYCVDIVIDAAQIGRKVLTANAKVTLS